MSPTAVTPDSPENGHSRAPQTVDREANWIPIDEVPAFTPQKLRVVCIGAGFAGLIMAHKLKYERPEMNDYIDFTIYEKNEDVGGTWYENRYPGIACDVPCHIYTFLFEPNPNWSHHLAGGEEIWRYIKDTTVKYGLDEKVSFSSKLTSSYWNEESGKWKLKVQQKDRIIEDEADILVSGAGILNKWKWPQIEGLKDFKGKLIHSAMWDSSYDWTDKKVAVIGNGSSAIQILPQIRQTAKKAVNYFRSPTWVINNIGSDKRPPGQVNYAYTEDEKRNFRNPVELLKYRKGIETEANGFIKANLLDGPEHAAAGPIFKGIMSDKLKNDPELCEKLIPKWSVGCRRLTPGEGYLEALQEPNCRPELSPIVRFTETGIQTEESHEDFDLIVCATGFDVSFKPFWDMEGRNGTRLDKEWAEDPEAYFATCAGGQPNYFFVNGPNCPIAHGSLIAVMDFNVDYIVRWIRKIARENIRSVCVKPKALKDYNVYTQEFLKRTVWSAKCRSWYKNGKTDGKISAVYAGSILHFKDMLEEIRGEDFDIDYRSPNQFKYMGNGFTELEVNGGDVAYYLKK